MKIQLEDDKAQFFMNEILSCGRAASGEQFLYRYYIIMWKFTEQDNSFIGIIRSMSQSFGI